MVSEPHDSWILRILRQEWIDRLLGPRALEGPEADLIRVRALVVFVVGLAVWVPFWVALDAWLGIPLMGLSIGVGGTIGCIILLVLARAGNPRAGGHLGAAVVSLTLAVNASLNGGLYGAALVWYPTVPVLALLFAGPRAGILWTGVVMAIIGAFGWAEHAGLAFYQEMPPAMVPVNYALVVMAFALFMSGVFRLQYEVLGWLSAQVEASRAARTQQILDAAGDGVVVVDAQGRVAMVNGATCEMLRRPTEALLGEDFLSVLQDWEGDIGGTSRGTFTGMANLSGEALPVEVTAAPVGTGGERVMILRDVSDRHRAREAMERALDAALEASQAKSRFLANMSHELRTPLNAVIGYAELMLDDIDAGQAVSDPDDLRSISEAGRHLLGLIDGVLDLARVESGKMPVQRGPMAVAELVDQLDATARALVHKRQNVWSVEVDPEAADLVLETDAMKVRQIVLNLVSNAAKFTERGTVRLAVSCTPDVVALEVIDTGIGMTPGQAARVWDEFVQADDDIRLTYGGTGLGLPLSRKLARLLGGELELTSAVDVGTHAVLTLPRWSAWHTDRGATTPA